MVGIPGSATHTTTSFRLPQSYLSRSRLLNQVNDVLTKKLVIVNAQRGYGASSLVMDWCRLNSQSNQIGMSWTNLKRECNDPEIFKRELILILSAYFNIKEPISQSQHSENKYVQGLSLNKLGNLSFVGSPTKEDIVVVLDGYENIHSQVIHDFLNKFIDELPSFLHLVIISKGLPPLRTTLRQATGQASVITQDDLLFSLEEIDAFIKSEAGYVCNQSELKSIQTVTSGWVIGLKLIALELAQSNSVAKIMNAIEEGSSIILADFAKDTLFSLSPAERDFLLQSSILKYISAEIISSVLNIDEGSLLIQSVMEKTYCYVLTANSLDTLVFQPLLQIAFQRFFEEYDQEMFMQLHKRATHYYLKTNDLELALQHTILSRNWSALCEVVTDNYFELNEIISKGGEIGLGIIPHDIVESNPFLLLLFTSAYLTKDDPINAEAFALKALNLLNRDLSLQEDRRAELLANANLSLTLSKAQQGKVDEAFALGQAALLRTSDKDGYLQSWLLNAMGAAAAKCDSYKTASSHLLECLEKSQEVDNLFVEHFATYFLANQYIFAGKLQRAKNTLDKLTIKLEQQDVREVPYSGLIELGLANIFLQQDHLDDAKNVLPAGIDKIRRGQGAEFFIDAQIVQACILDREGKTEDALFLLGNTIRFASKRKCTHALMIAKAHKANLSIKAGDDLSVESWLKDIPALKDTEDFPLHVINGLTYAKAQKHKGNIDDAERTIQEISEKIEGAGFEKYLIDAHIQSAVISLEKNNGCYFDSFMSAIKLAAKEEIFYPFVSEGKTTARIISRAQSDGSISASSFTTSEKAFLFSVEEKLNEFKDNNHIISTPVSVLNILTKREYEVCRILAQGYSTHETASKLFISENTVQTHRNSIYSKLGIHSRRELKSLFESVFHTHE